MEPAIDQKVKKQASTLFTAHFIQPWSARFGLSNGFDIFFDPFSNCLIFFKEGYFVVWDQYDRLMAATNAPSNVA